MEPIIRERVETISSELVEAYRTVGVGDIGHFKVSGFIDTAIRPDEAEPLLQSVTARFGNTPNIREWLGAGKSIQEYPGVQEFLSQKQR